MDLWSQQYINREKNPYEAQGSGVVSRAVANMNQPLETKVKRLEWDIANNPTNPLADAITGNKVQADLSSAKGELAYSNANRKYMDELKAAGYSGWQTNFHGVKDWGAHGTMGGIGEKGAQDLYTRIFDQSKASGDWSAMDNFFDQAQYGDRKYHRGGFMGTGIDLMPKSLLGAAGLFAGAAAGLGVFSGIGIPGLVPGSGVAGSSNSLAAVSSGGGSGTVGAAGGASQVASQSGSSMLNAATATAQPGALGATAGNSAAGASVLNSGITAGATGGLPAGGAGLGGAAAASAPSVLSKISTFLSSPTGKAVKAGASVLKEVIGGVMDFGNYKDATNSLDSLAQNTGPSAQTQHAIDDLDEAIHGVDRDAYIKEQMRQYTANASAKHGVDSGAYIQGMQQVIGNSILELAKFQADASYSMGSLSQQGDTNQFANQGKILGTQFSLDHYRNYNFATTASKALDFIFS